MNELTLQDVMKSDRFHEMNAVWIKKFEEKNAAMQRENNMVEQEIQIFREENERLRGELRKAMSLAEEVVDLRENEVERQKEAQNEIHIRDEKIESLQSVIIILSNSFVKRELRILLN